MFQPPGETFGYIQVWFFAMPMDLAGIFTLGVGNRGVINWEGTSPKYGNPGMKPI